MVLLFKKIVANFIFSICAVSMFTVNAFAEDTCSTLPVPADATSINAPTSAASILSRSQGAGESWRAIDTLVLLPTEFRTNPDTGLTYEMSDQALEAQVRLSIAQANIHLRPLRVYLRVVEIHHFKDVASDPFAKAAALRNGTDMLSIARSIQDSFPVDHDFTLVLGRGYFRGLYGLAHSSASCQYPEYSVAFATQGGSADRLSFMLGHTIAHETGHFLGMSHDYDTHDEGISVMAPRPATHEFGFSDTSIERALARIAPGLPGGACFAETNKPGFAHDKDFDGISDDAERALGTSANDAGSYPSQLAGTVHAPWNSFLDAMNIVEISNPSEEDTTVELELLAQNGAVLSELSFSLGGGQQRDIILDSLPGFVRNSYGLVKLSFTGKLDGRTTYYRMSPATGDYEFAYAIPFLNAVSDVSTVFYNTFQPSLAVGQLAYQVANWLTLVNLSDETAEYRIVSFDQVGAVLKSRDVTLAPKSRIDIDGGHGFAGPNRVGTHQIIPANPANQYVSFLTRYGSNSVGNTPANKYYFAFPLLARAGTAQETITTISQSASQDNWVELSNTSGSNAVVDLEFFNEEGTTLLATSVEIAPMSQLHIDAAHILRSAFAAHGSILVRPRGVAKVSSTSMVYHRAENGEMQALYGLAAQEATQTRVSGSYNVFLNASNEITLHNGSATIDTVRALLRSNEGVFEHEFAIQPHATLVLDAHSLGAQNDTYGVLEFETSKKATITGSVVRLRRVGSALHFAIPTNLR